MVEKVHKKQNRGRKDKRRKDCEGREGKAKVHGGRVEKTGENFEGEKDRKRRGRTESQKYVSITEERKDGEEKEKKNENGMPD